MSDADTIREALDLARDLIAYSGLRGKVRQRDDESEYVEAERLLERFDRLVAGSAPDPRDAECAICGHAWRRHDPEDGRCDAGSAPGEPFGVCECGRDLAWMQTKSAALSRAALRSAATGKETE